MKPIRLSLIVLSMTAALGVGFVAMAHENDGKEPPKTQHPADHMEHAMTGMSEGSRELHQAMANGMKMPMPMTGNVDTDFATMMTKHHKQAIAMSDVLLKHGKNPELRALAQKMQASQREEIQKMAPYVAPAKK